MTAATCSVPAWGWSISDEVESAPSLPVRPAIEGAATTLSGADASLAGVKVDVLEAEALRELEQYLALPEGWDGYGGVTFDLETVIRVGFLARWVADYFRSVGAVPDAMTPGPAGDGSVDLEIALGDAYLLFTLTPDICGCDVCFGGEGAEDIEERCRFERASVDDWLERLVSQKTGARPVAAA